MATIEELEQLLIHAKLQIAQKSGEVDVINYSKNQWMNDVFSQQ